jgi:hypothetical protein
MQNKQLSNSQQVALSDLITWYNSSSSFGILEGAAGTGKTYLVQHLITALGKNIKPLLLAETNEAASVLARSTNNKYPTQTVCSALGLTLGHEGSKQVLVQRIRPDLSEFNLVAIDEASMLDELRLELLYEAGIRILFIGHGSQLPPVDVSQSSIDKCISPIFTKGYPMYSLVDNIRNKGELAVFCDKAEGLITNRGILPNNYCVSKNFVTSYLQERCNIDSIVLGDTVALAWSNKAVVEHNTNLRKSIFGAASSKETFITGDRVIFRSPTAKFNFPADSNAKTLTALAGSPDSSEQLSTNTKATVNFVNEVTLLGIACYELKVTTDSNTAMKQDGIVYVAIDEDAFNKLKYKMYQVALYEINPAIANKKWKSYHDLSLVFSNCKHAYAITVHCSQGSTIRNVFVDDKDINKCSNPYLKKKLKYVAYSRASTELYRLS